MTGKRIPLVLIPRYTSFIGSGRFVTAAVEVSSADSAEVYVWRSRVIGATPTISVEFEESTNQESWTTCTGGTAFDPGERTETSKSVALSRRYLRVVVTLGGTDPAASCFAYGYLNGRQN